MLVTEQNLWTTFSREQVPFVQKCCQLIIQYHNESDVNVTLCYAAVCFFAPSFMLNAECDIFVLAASLGFMGGGDRK